MICVQTDKIQLNATLSTPVMLASTQIQTVYLRIGLTGFSLKNKKTAPINVALVIDKSGSMRGEKIRCAKEAAMMAIDMLRPNDTIAIVTYNHSAEILLPACQVQKKERLKATINKLLLSGGQTALYDGLEKGAKEVRKFLNRNQINRMILISDGIANIGPSQPKELGALGASLAKDNIAVTTIGLGLQYHEDLMTQLAEKSDGNHAFVENASDLTQFFEHEFGDILSVVSQEVNVVVMGVDGVRPLRVLGREAKINGQQVLVKLNQLYSEQEKYVLVELEVPPIEDARLERMIAGVAVIYRNMDTDIMERFSSKVSIHVTDDVQCQEKNTDRTVMTAVAEQLAVEKNKLAVKLRDEGCLKEAHQVLLTNAAFLAEESAKYGSERLKKLKDINLNDANHLEDEEKWLKQRKSMRQQQYKWQNQQTY
jgi:Ca-activated chloride channel family protein